MEIHKDTQTSVKKETIIPEFSSFEHQKENIFPLREGRKASSLSLVFGNDSSSRQAGLEVGHAKFRAELEKIHELDDPFDVYNQYIKWTMENYPQGQNPQSNLIQLFERALKEFVHDTRYKNDPRYLRCWIQYSKFIGQSKEFFIFLKVNGIGMDLAAYYEEYAEFMERLNRCKEADEIYTVGISRKAQPLERLTRRYRQFLTRLSSLQETNNQLQRTESSQQQNDENSQRIILGVRDSINSTPLNIFNQRNSQSINVNRSTLPSTALLNKKLGTDTNEEKLIIFHDPDGEVGNSALTSSETSGIWRDFGTELGNKKENTKEAESWKGATLPETSKKQISSSDTILKSNTILTSNTNAPNIRPKGNCTENTFVDLNTIYANGNEYSFEELRAKSKSHDRPTSKTNSVSEYYEPIPGMTPNPPNIKKLVKKPSPTINTKAAFADIMELFNQPLNCEQNEDYQEDGELNSKQTNFLNQTSSDPKSDILKTPQNHSRFNDNVENIRSTNYSNLCERENNRKIPFELMTPIRETSREYKLNSIETTSNTDKLNEIKVIVDSTSNLIEKEEAKESHSDALEFLYPMISNPCNPLDSRLIDQVLNSLKPPLNQFPGLYYARDQISNNHGKIEKLARCGVKSDRRHSTNSEVPIELFNDSFLIRQKVGEGGFGKIYHVLDMNKDLEDSQKSRVLKLQMPPSAWEFYIIRKLHEKIASPMIDSIITVHSLYYFKDESYLLEEYCNHGSILDIVNASKKSNTVMDEILVFFFTVELLKVIEAIHKVGIIHGDIKADNCLLRLEQTSEWNSKYESSGANGWSKKGIKLIDFGRAIDVTLFRSDMKFIADWKTDDQDCVEMREGRPWKWQADYYGIAGVIHCMLHNEYMQITPIRVEDDTYSSGAVSISTRKYKPIQSFKRYWQGELWRRLFHMLLNPTLVRSDGQLPITEELREIRRECENYLVMNCNKIGRSLKDMLYKLETSSEIR
ncbi:6112_t:CDS:2 [Diversispora eburnea]|uniref:6112_t:CDS:1 n=1 Tax=Diversispora eburnea TaxID=1213867 RepID=A0A9N9A884_9GLOM|nr:6112_t:CDS:2 [Diversispora eburnea]